MPAHDKRMLDYDAYGRMTPNAAVDMLNIACHPFW